MNEDAYLEQVAKQEFEAANNRPYGQFKYRPEEPGYGPEFCEECGVDMPIARREYGFVLCVKCRELEERKSAHN